MDGQRNKLVTVVGHEFITLTVYICVQHGGREAQRRAGLSATAETCYIYDDDGDNDDDDLNAPANPVYCNAFDLVKVVPVQHGGPGTAAFHFIQRFCPEIDVVDRVGLRAYM